VAVHVISTEGKGNFKTEFSTEDKDNFKTEESNYETLLPLLLKKIANCPCVATDG
jgi:hypothetical protein